MRDVVQLQDYFMSIQNLSKTWWEGLNDLFILYSSSAMSLYPNTIASLSMDVYCNSNTLLKVVDPDQKIAL